MTAAVRVEGLLDVNLVLGRGGRTQVAAITQRFPQRVTAPMYLDPEDPATAYLCVQNPTGGVFPGDRLRTTVTTGPGARLQMTGQSATQVYAGGGLAEQHYRFTLSANSVVEHLPKNTIPHRGSAYRQTTRISTTGDAVYLGWEVVAAGRIGHGEQFEYDAYRADTVVSCGGAVCARDTVRLEPARRSPGAQGVLAGHAYLASFLVVAPRRAVALAELLTRLNGQLRADPGVLGAASALPDQVGITVRVLGDRAPSVHSALSGLWLAARQCLLGRDRLPERICR